MSSKMASKAHILIVPFPSQSHLLPLLDFVYLLSTRHPTSLAITIVVTTENLLPRLESLPSNITPLVLPGLLENINNLPTTGIPAVIHALGNLSTPLCEWAKTHKPRAIIANFLCGWTKQIADNLGIPNYIFSPNGAFATCVINTVWKSQPKRSNPDDDNELFVFDSIPGSPAFPWNQLPYLYRTFEPSNPTSEFIKSVFLSNIESSGFIFNTFRALESQFLEPDKFCLRNGSAWAVGPLAAASRRSQSSVISEDIATFLDSCKPKSVVYICFGSQAGLTATPASALATALEISGVRFLWCVGTATTVPEGFEEQMAGRGMVVSGWVAQVAILSHGSVGAFLSHCGWNSTSESVSAGVPMLTWPLNADQFFNARLVNELGIARVACARGMDVVPDIDELARAISESVWEFGKEMRERAMELGRKAREAVGVGGSSYEDLDDLVNRICGFR